MNGSTHTLQKSLFLMYSLFTRSQPTTFSNKNVSKRKFIPPAVANIKTKTELLNLGATLQLASELIDIHRLNKDQATALIQIAQMMASQESGEDTLEPCTHSLPVTIIHGKKETVVVNVNIYRLFCFFVVF